MSRPFSKAGVSWKMYNILGFSPPGHSLLLEGRELMNAIALGLVFLLGQNGAALPTDVWPQWRGPTADSIAPGKGLPTKWSKTDNIAWKTPLPGWGTSTPAIWK